MAYILAIDQGTTSSRAILFRPDTSIAAQAQREVPQHFPAPGWVEHEPEDLWRTTVARRSASYMAEAKGAAATSADHAAAPEADPADQGYAGVALGVMTAISRNERQTMILNVRNNGTIAGLPDGAVVEVPTLVDANGVHPLTLDQPDLHQLGLMAQVKSVERDAITAASTGSRSAAVRAFALHPLVDSLPVANSLVAGYLARLPQFAAVLTR